MSVQVAPHRGEATTRALVEAAISTSTGPSTGSGTGTDAAVEVIIDADYSFGSVGVGDVVRTVGPTASATYSATDITTTATGTSFSLADHRVSLALVGERHVVPALAAIAVAIELGADLPTAIARIEPVRGVEPDNFALRQLGRVLVIDDSYDVGSRSTVEALKSVAEIAGESRRSIAVLGPLAMASADPIDVRDEHDRIGRIVVRLNIGQLVVIGAGGRHLSTAAGLEGSWDGESVLVETADEAYDLVRAEIREGDVVLVKVPSLAARLTEVLS